MRAIATEEINAKYAQYREKLGAPITIDVIKDIYQHNGYFKEYQNGAIYWTPDTCAHEVDQVIYGKLKQLNEINSASTSQPEVWGGYPITDTLMMSDGIGRYNYLALTTHQEPYAIIVSKDNVDAKGLKDKIFQKWERLGAERSILKYPIADQLKIWGLSVSFEGGRLYYGGPSEEPYELHGPILDKYIELGEDRALNYPSRDTSPTADGGLYAYFHGFNPNIPDGLAIFWSQVTGAHWLYYDMLLKWESEGSERSCLRYPESDPYQIENSQGVFLYQRYQGGYQMLMLKNGTLTTICYDRVQGTTGHHICGPGDPYDICGTPDAPVNEIEGPNGEKIPIVPIFDEEGNQLPMRYADGPVLRLTEEDKPPACMGPDLGVHQEGVLWDIPRDYAAIGASVRWTSPRDLNGITSSTDYGIWYNPVNFYYDTTPGITGDLDYFFQVDFGVGNNLKANGFAMTFAIPEIGYYYTKPLPTIPVRAGSTYIIDAFLYLGPDGGPYFVVQITLEGVAGWVARYPLDLPIHAGTDYIKRFQSFNDIYIQTGGTAYENVGDHTSEFALIHQSGTSRTRSLDAVYGLRPFEKIEPHPRDPDLSTYDILSAKTGDTIAYQNVIDCTSWPG